MEIKVYTDGSCLTNPGKGGYAALVVIPNEKPVEISGGFENTTNNRMEIYAAVAALQYAHQISCENRVTVNIFSDSRYLIDGITSWIDGWKKRNWQTKRRNGKPGEPVKNQDLWMELDELTRGLTVNWYWVRGHDGNEYNEIADKLASEAAKTTTAPA